MAGFFFDIVIEYICRVFGRAFTRLKSARWTRCNAIVTDIDLRPRSAFGCPLVKITYRLDDKTSERFSSIPFLLPGAAEDYAHSEHQGDVIVIRVHPRRPTRTVFYPSDQR